MGGGDGEEMQRLSPLVGKATWEGREVHIFPYLKLLHRLVVQLILCTYSGVLGCLLLAAQRWHGWVEERTGVERTGVLS